LGPNPLQKIFKKRYFGYSIYQLFSQQILYVEVDIKKNIYPNNAIPKQCLTAKCFKVDIQNVCWSAQQLQPLAFSQSHAAKAGTLYSWNPHDH
jgi:hypothetical protein